MAGAVEKPPLAKDYRILVIEDEEYIREIIVRLLKQMGYGHVAEAVDGESGFKEMLRTKPDLILCDIHMEPINGLEFLRRLRKLGKKELAEKPVIFLTADVQKDTVVTAVGLKVDGYLAKPVSQNALRDKITQVMIR